MEEEVEGNAYFCLQLPGGLKGMEGSQGLQGPPGRRVSIPTCTKSHTVCRFLGF